MERLFYGKWLKTNMAYNNLAPIIYYKFVKLTNAYTLFSLDRYVDVGV